MKKIIGKILFYCRFPDGVTTSIYDTTEYGYGYLDSNGFWEWPVPQSLIIKRRQRKAKEKKQ